MLISGTTLIQVTYFVAKSIKKVVQNTLGAIFTNCMAYIASQDPQKISALALTQKALKALKTTPLTLTEVRKAEQTLTKLVPAFFCPLTSDLLTEEEVIFQKEGLAGINRKLLSTQEMLCTSLRCNLFQTTPQEETKEDTQRIAFLTSQLFRLYDIFYKLKNPVEVSDCEPFLQLQNTTYVSQSSHQKNAMEEIPAYLHYFAHALDSDKQIDEINMTDDLGDDAGKRLYANLLSSYVKTLIHCTESMFLSRSFEKLDALALKAVFFEVAKKLLNLHQLDPQERLYRWRERVVYDPQMDFAKFTSLASFFQERSETQKSELFQEIAHLLLRWDHNFNKAHRFFQRRHWEVLKSCGVHVCPPASQVPPLLESFFQKLEQHLKNEKLHPFQVASFILYSLCKIHPFDKNNGVCCRLFMNLYLMQKGFVPIILFKEIDWLALFQEEDFEAACCAYLDKTIQEAKQNLENGSLPNILNLFAWQGNYTSFMGPLDRVDS